MELDRPDNGDYSVEMYNSTGQKVYHTAFGNNENWKEVDVQNFRTGVYFISVYSANDRLVKKVIVE